MSLGLLWHSSLSLMSACEQTRALLRLLPPALSVSSLPFPAERHSSAFRSSESFVVCADGSVIVVLSPSWWWGRSLPQGCVLLLRQCNECPQSRTGPRWPLSGSDNLGQEEVGLFSSPLTLHHLRSCGLLPYMPFLWRQAAS